MSFQKWFAMVFLLGFAGSYHAATAGETQTKTGTPTGVSSLAGAASKSDPVDWKKGGRCPGNEPPPIADYPLSFYTTDKDCNGNITLHYRFGAFYKNSCTIYYPAGNAFIGGATR